MKYAVLILLLSTGFSTAADDEASKKLLKELEGTYKNVSGESSGEAIPKILLDRIEKISIKDGKYSMTYRNEKQELKTVVSSFTVDATKKPVCFDMKLEVGPSFGIIEIDGDTIKICSSLSDKKRPTQFKTTKEDQFVLTTLKKMKE